MKYFFIVLGILICLPIFSQGYKVSENKRYIVKDNKPFIWLGDTAWELFHRCSKEDTEFYFQTRAEQGFTVVQAVILAELDGLHKPNFYGHTPLFNDDPTQLNEDYFSHVEQIIDQAADHNITMAILPTWGDKIFKNTWGTGPEIFNTKNAYEFGNLIGKKFKNKKNIIWVIGGDRNPRNGSKDTEVWRSMAQGLTQAYGHKDSLLITFHPQPNGEGASEWFHDDDWFDFNMFQTGHCRDLPVYENMMASYNRLPTKPVLNGEPIYEAHPVCFNAKDLGYASAYDIRKAAYLSILSGSFGHTYGCHAVWQMYSDRFEGINGPLANWKNSLNLQGANQIRHLRKLTTLLPLHELVPAQDLLLENDKSAYERIQAGKSKNHIVVYSALGKSFSLNFKNYQGIKNKSIWFNPRTGEMIESLFDIPKDNTWKKFTPPSAGYGLDWVLIVGL
jgi:hypothetical protein